MPAPTGSTTDLLSLLIQTMGPCPSVCDYSARLGFTAGTSIIDIKTGLPPTQYPPYQ